MRHWSLFILIFLTLPLAGCISREEADNRMARACAAGAELFLNEGYRIEKIKDMSARTNKDLGNDYRQITLKVVETDGWYEADQEYRCIFIESFSIFGLDHTASIYQLKLHDKTYGKEGDEVLGTFEDHMRLTNTIEREINKNANPNVSDQWVILENRNGEEGGE